VPTTGIKVEVVAGEEEEEAFVGAEIPPKYRDRSLWARLRFDSFGLGLGLDELGVDDDEDDGDWVVGWLLFEFDVIELALLVLGLVLVLALGLELVTVV